MGARVYGICSSTPPKKKRFLTSGDNDKTVSVVDFYSEIVSSWFSFCFLCFWGWGQEKLREVARRLRNKAQCSKKYLMYPKLWVDARDSLSSRWADALSFASLPVYTVAVFWLPESYVRSWNEKTCPFDLSTSKTALSHVLVYRRAKDLCKDMRDE